MSKKPGKGGKKDDGDPNAAAKVFILGNKCQEFQRAKAIEQEKADKSKVSENALRERIIELDKLFTAQREKLYNMTTEMNKQYKTMQDALLTDINDLKSNVKKQTEQIEQKDQQIKDMTIDYESKLARKEEEIVDLKKKIDDMSNEFARMLRETLDKMQERIEMTQWNDESDPQMLKKLKETGGIQK